MSRGCPIVIPRKTEYEPVKKTLIDRDAFRDVSLWVSSER
jgi:hypothetical protein